MLPVSLTGHFTFLTIFSHFSALSPTDDSHCVGSLCEAEFMRLLSFVQIFLFSDHSCHSLSFLKSLTSIDKIYGYVGYFYFRKYIFIKLWENMLNCLKIS